MEKRKKGEGERKSGSGLGKVGWSKKKLLCTSFFLLIDDLKKNPNLLVLRGKNKVFGHPGAIKLRFGQAVVTSVNYNGSPLNPNPQKCVLNPRKKYLVGGRVTLKLTGGGDTSPPPLIGNFLSRRDISQIWSILMFFFYKLIYSCQLESSKSILWLKNDPLKYWIISSWEWFKHFW